jgi:hypothetical protein
MIGTVFSMMTETNFWDMFNKKHNSKYYAQKKKQIQESKYVLKTQINKRTGEISVLKIQD